MNTPLQDTIVALATPPMKSALAIVRMSGSQSFSILEKIFSKPITLTQSQMIFTGWVQDGEEKIDQVVALDRKSTRLNSSHVRTSRMPSSA